MPKRKTPAQRLQTEQQSTRAEPDGGPESSNKTEGKRRRRCAARPLAKDLWPDRHFWGLVLQPQRGDAVGQAGKDQLVSREYHLHITQATLLVDEDAAPREAATARTQLWIANSNHGEAEERVPRLVCSLSANGRESQKLDVRLSGQRVRLIAVGQGCTIHLSGCLEQLPEEEEDDDSDNMWDDDSSADSDSEIESGSGSDAVPDNAPGGQSGSQLSAMLAALDDSDSGDEDYA
eukprot:COSAG02_NODE_2490_length_8694_cov_3.602909_9_plen_234_part_00